jgi:hypothetical protein
LLALAPVGAAADGDKLEAAGAFADQSASEALRSSLEPKGHRVVLGDGTTLCEIWLRKQIPTRARASVAGAFYTELPESAFVGVISFPKGARDYRGQQVKAGAYTLRYTVHPSDGNHLGISVYRDFLVLSPVGADENPGAVLNFEELMKLSAKTLGSVHPSPISLVSPEGLKSVPGVATNDHGNLIFAARVKTEAGSEMPIAFVVKGQAEQ